MYNATLFEIKTLAEEAREELEEQASDLDRDVKIYLHWTAGHYNQFFDDYHINIDCDGSIYLSTMDLAETLSHTWRRNTGSIGITLCCAYGATTDDLGDEPPTLKQIDTMAKVIAVLSEALDIPIDIQHILTHGEAADNLDGEYLHEPYGIFNGCERWDLAILSNEDEFNSGGDILRGLANWYKENETL